MGKKAQKNIYTCIGTLLTLLTLLFASLNNVSLVQAATGVKTYLTDNRNAQDYTGQNWSKHIYNYLVELDSGYMRVYLKWDDAIYVEYFDNNYQFQNQKVIRPELSMFGGFYAGKDNYYLVYGEMNSEESDDFEVVRIVKYDKQWCRIASASVYGANTTIPFYAGCVRMAENNGLLYIRSSHEMYESKDGLNHQANMTIIVNQDDMSIFDQETQIGSYSEKNEYYLSYVSHSFNQFVIADDAGDIVFLDQGDAYPRAAKIAKQVKEKGEIGESQIIMPYSGTPGDNDTGATIGGLEYSLTNYLTVGTVGAYARSQDLYDVGNYIYLSVNDKQLQDQTKIIQLTKPLKNKLYSTPVLVKMSDKKFLILWTETRYVEKDDSYLSDGKIRYVYVNGEGELLGSTKTVQGYLSDCKPIVANEKVVWTVSDNKNLKFNYIDENGAYSSIDAGYPNKMIKYPIDISGCHLVAKKIGPISCKSDTMTQSELKKSFVLYTADSNRQLEYGSEYTLDSYKTASSSLWHDKWYIQGVLAESDGELSIGERTFETDMLWWDPPTFIHERPQNVSAKRIESGIEIKWQEEPYALGYYVYRKSGNSSYKKIATISDASKNSYIDKKVSKNKTYSYYIKTYTTNGKKLISTKRSEIKTVK